jgi:hypothetical protein
MTNLELYVKERDKALLSFDVKKMKKLCKKWEIPAPADDLVFYAGMMKAICELNKATLLDKTRAKKWLINNGFEVGIKGC